MIDPIVKSLLSFLLTISFISRTMGMQNQTAIMPSPFDEINIVFNIFTYSIKKIDTLQAMRNHIVGMSLVNKELNKFVNNKETTQTIIDKISGQYNQGFFAKKIKTPGMINYLKKSSALYHNINNIKFKRIGHLIEQGADVNYFPHGTKNCKKKCPLLFKVIYNNYDRTEELLKHGANLNVLYNGKTALQRMIEKSYFPMSRLLISFNPQRKYLALAVYLKNPYIIECILKSGTIPLEELNDALAIAIGNDNEILSLKLIAAGAELDELTVDEQEKFKMFTSLR